MSTFLESGDTADLRTFEIFLHEVDETDPSLAVTDPKL